MNISFEVLVKAVDRFNEYYILNKVYVVKPYPVQIYYLLNLFNNKHVTYG